MTSSRACPSQSLPSQTTQHLQGHVWDIVEHGGAPSAQKVDLAIAKKRDLWEQLRDGCRGAGCALVAAHQASVHDEISTLYVK